MSLNSGIQWCHHSHGFWRGCEKVSLGCAKCYAERDMNRYGQDFHLVTRSKSFDAPLKWLRSGKAQPGELVFICPWSDFFIEQSDGWRPEALDVIREASDLDFLILTKRIERVPHDLFRDFKNVWLLVSVEDQKTANKRIPQLLQREAAIRGVSFEPLLGNIKFPPGDPTWELGLDWAVVGGESDPTRPRKMEETWALNLVAQLRAWKVPVFFKQNGGSKKIDGHWGGNRLAGEIIQEFPPPSRCPKPLSPHSSLF